MASFLEELKRRKVFRVAAGYAVVAWLIAQIVAVLATPLRLPDWFGTVVIVLLAIGFPIALIFAWALELTPEGLRRERPAAATPPLGTAREDTEPGPPGAGRRRRAIVVATVGAVALAFVVAAGFAILAPLSRPVPVTSPAEYEQLTSFSDSVLDPALSPDGRMVTFIRGGQRFPRRGGQIYVKLLPSGESMQLTDTPNPKYGPVFSPDGSRIAYTEVSLTRDGASWDTWTVPVLGGTASRLLPNAAGLAWLDAQHVLFSEIKGTGLHMGIVTATEGRSEHREIYFPEHERAMAHYSYASPDKNSILVVEMDRTQAFQPCRLVPFDGSSPGRQVGPQGECLAAAWSADGEWMYFSVRVEGLLHLWRQRYPDGTPEQITFGPTEEEGVAVAADGRSLVTAIGQRQSVIVLHDASGERPLTSEGVATMPRLSRDGRRVYFLLSEGAGSTRRELHVVDLTTASIERVLPDVTVDDYAISQDGTEVAYSTETADGDHEIWLALLDRRRAPQRVARSGDAVSFGTDDDLLFLGLEEHANFLTRVRKDGTQRMRVSDTPILAVWGISPDGRWAAAGTSGTPDHPAPGTIAIPIAGGEPRWLCDGYCRVFWSQDGATAFLAFEVQAATADAAVTEQSPSRVFVLGLPPGESLPALPAGGVSSPDAAAALPAAREIALPSLSSPGAGPSTYVFERPQLQRNLFRIPLD